MNKIIVSEVSDNIDLKNLYKEINKKFDIKNYSEFLVIRNEKEIYFIYNYGVIICWGKNNYNRDLIINKFILNKHQKIEETYFYEKNNNFEIKSDLFLIPDDTEIKIAISYALSQSIKLNYFEEEIDKKINKYKNIPYEIKKRGKTKLSGKEILKIKGELFITKSLLNLHYDLLDEPEYFWDYPKSIEYYEQTRKYLDIDDRIEILNKKISVLEELFDMLTDEINHKHEVFLEWIIIWLIVIEVFISIFHDILKLF